MIKVKNFCQNCGYSQRYTKKEMFWFYLKGIFSMIIMAAGFLFIVFLIIVGPNTTLDMMSSSVMTKYSIDYATQDELRSMAIEYAGPNCGDDTMCYAKNIYDKTKEIPYIPASKMTPIQLKAINTLNGSDCKGLSILYTALMKSVGQDAIVLCSMKYEHCISRVNINSTNFLVIDLTGPTAVMMNSFQDEWEYMNNMEMMWR